MDTKLLAALIVVGVLAVAVVGLVAAQVVTSSPSPNGTASNGALIGGFFGWMGRLMGLGGAYGSQSPTYVGQPQNITVTNPRNGTTTTYQGYYDYSG